MNVANFLRERPSNTVCRGVSVVTLKIGLTMDSMACRETGNVQPNTGEEGPGHPALPLIAAEEVALTELESEVNELRDNVLSLEARVAELGDGALTMPEDLGDWSEAPPRVSGLVVRIVQTYQLAVQVASLGNDCHYTKPSPSIVVDCRDVDAANDEARQEMQ